VSQRPAGRSEAGYFAGKHFTDYVEQIETLLAHGHTPGEEREAERILVRLVDATEAEDRVQGDGVAPWYYETLADLYGGQDRLDDELAILERFARQRHAPGASPPRLLARLERRKHELAGDVQWLAENSDSWQLLDMGEALLDETPAERMLPAQRLDVLDVFRRAYDIAPNRYKDHKATILRAIGEVLLSSGNKAQALESFRAALALNPKVGVKRLASKLEKDLRCHSCDEEPES